MIKIREFSLSRREMGRIIVQLQDCYCCGRRVGVIIVEVVRSVN